MKCCIQLKKDDYKLILTGLATGLVNGLLGAGGGMVLVPLLLFWCRLPERETCATSVAVIAPFCVVSAVIYFCAGNPFPEHTLWYCLGGLVGGTAGGWLLGKVPSKWIIKLFGAIMVVAGVRRFF